MAEPTIWHNVCLKLPENERNLSCSHRTPLDQPLPLRLCTHPGSATAFFLKPILDLVLLNLTVHFSVSGPCSFQGVSLTDTPPPGQKPPYGKELAKLFPRVTIFSYE